MDEFLSTFENKSSFDKLKAIIELCDDIWNHSPSTLDEFLMLLVKKYDHLANEFSKIEVATQTDYGEELTNDWNIKNIADDVASVAKKNLEENGFVYDQNSGLYYDHKQQCFYNPQLKLYYYEQTKAYYYYDEQSRDLKFYCVASSEPKAHVGSHRHTQKKEHITEKFQEKHNDIVDTNRSYTSVEKEVTWKPREEVYSSDKEDGECSESDEELQLSPRPVIIEAGPKTFEPDHSKHIAPCIRAIVKSSSVSQLSPGTLFIVTCTGGTLGREGDHDILIPEQLVSKHHATFRYVYKDGEYIYEIIDAGSKNGTFISGKRLSNSLVESEPTVVSHGTIITVGTTELLFHIHPKNETCSDCEAYSVLREKKSDLIKEKSLKEKHSEELTTIKKKFMLKTFIPKYPAGYEDRSENRRKHKGSSHPSEKTDSASTDVAIKKQNKGFALMTKMGWVEGSSLGKNNGILEPISVKKHEGQMGLGCEDYYYFTTPQVNSKDSKKLALSKKTMDRFQQSPN